MSSLAYALEVLLKHSGIPEENEDRDAVQAAIEELRTTTHPKATRTAKEER